MLPGGAERMSPLPDPGVVCGLFAGIWHAAGPAGRVRSRVRLRDLFHSPGSAGGQHPRSRGPNDGMFQLPPGAPDGRSRFHPLKQERIIVLGTGYVGLPAALLWAKSGWKVVGVDIDKNVVRAINDGTMMLNEHELQSLLADPLVKRNLIARSTPCAGEVFVIAVPTPVDRLRKVCDLGAVEAAVESILPHLRKGNLVILESTVPPMTRRNVLKPLIEKRIRFKVPRDILLAHCPERILPGDIFQEIIHNDRLIGGV